MSMTTWMRRRGIAARVISTTMLLVMTLATVGCYTTSVDGGMIMSPHTSRDNVSGDYRMIAHFKDSRRAGWLLAGIIPIRDPAGSGSDWSYDTVVREINRSGGDAAINVRIKSQFSFLDYIIGGLLMGFYVTRKHTVSGEIVRFGD